MLIIIVCIVGFIALCCLGVFMVRLGVNRKNDYLRDEMGTHRNVVVSRHSSYNPTHNSYNELQRHNNYVRDRNNEMMGFMMMNEMMNQQNNDINK